MENFRKSLKDSARVRWGILFLIAFVQAANYYFYDSLSPLKRLLEENFNISSTDYGFLIAAYSLPNTFLLMAIFGGVILDRIGIKKTGFIFVGMMAIGGVITAYGASEYYSNGGFGYSFFNSFLTGYSPELKMMFLGRLFFGLGAETSIVVVSKIIVKWFKGKELAFAFGMKIGIARAGSALALFYSAEIAEAATHWTIAIWFAAMLLLIAFLAFLVYTIFDVRLDKQIKQVNLTGNDDKFRFADIGTLFKNKSFIYVTLLCLTFYSAVFPFQAFSPDFMLNKFGMSLTQSGKIASILYWVTMFATPLFGLFIDKIGKSASIMIFGSVLLTLIHLTFAFTNLNPVIPLVLLGISIALVPAAMWPSVAKIVPEKRIGSAYGAMFSIQNLGLFAFPILAGFILETTNKNSEIYILSEEVKSIKNTKEFTVPYLNNSDKPLKNKKLLASLTILDMPDTINLKKEKNSLKKQLDKYGTVIWDEYFQTKSDKKGNFTGTLGTDSTDKINIHSLNINPEKDIIIISAIDTSKSIILKSNNYKIDTALNYINFSPKLNKNDLEILKDHKNVLLTIYDTVRKVRILEEEHNVFIDENLHLRCEIGKSRLRYANFDYLILPYNAVIKIQTPLNYTFTILIFAVLGLFGFIFALLLKREDKKSGYSLELPSNKKK